MNLQKAQATGAKGSVWEAVRWVALFIVVIAVSVALGLLTGSQRYRRFNLKNEDNRVIYILVTTKEVHAASGETIKVYLVRNNYKMVMVTPDEVQEIEPGPEDIKWPKP